MKFFSLVLLVFLCFGKKDDIKVINAQYQNWTAGIGTSNGTKYFFTCITNKSSEQIEIDKVWVKDKLLLPGFYAIKNNTPQKSFEKGDTIIVTCSNVINTEYKGEKILNDNSSNEPLPYKYEGEALISYKSGNKRKYIVVKEIKKTNPLLYPQKQ